MSKKDDTNERLSMVEGDLSLVKAEIAGVKSDISHVSQQISNLSRSMHDIASTITRDGRTNWATLASWAAVILTVVSLGSYGFIRDITRNESRMTVSEQKFEEHISNGHPKIVIDKTEKNGESIRELEKHLNTSNQDLREFFRAELKDLENRLERSDEADRDRILALEKRVLSIPNDKD